MHRSPYRLVADEASSAQSRAYQFIRDNVISGAYVGGMKLLPDMIASELGMSRMPVREALRQLDAEGLVTLRPNQRAVVTPLSPAEIEELFEIRSVLEGLSARLAAKKASDDDIAELQLLNSRLQRVRLDGRDWLRHHHEFHDFVCMIGGQERLLKEIRRIRTAVDPYLLLYISIYRREMAGAEHAVLIDAIRSSNGRLAERTFANHVMSAGRGVIEFLAARQNAKIERKAKKESQ